MGATIGLSGYSGSGKDYLADKIIAAFPEYNFKKVYFAAHLKECAAKMLNLPVEMMYTTEGKNSKIPWLDGMTVRTFLQKFGSDAVRANVHEDFWVRALVAKIKDDENVIIPDMRFENELEAVKKIGYTIRVRRLTSFENWDKVSGLNVDDIHNFGKHADKTDYINSASEEFGIDHPCVLSMIHSSEVSLDFAKFDWNITMMDGATPFFQRKFMSYLFDNGYIKITNGS